MLSNFPLVGFIPAIDRKRARGFYVDLLKLDLVAEDDFAIVVAAKGATVRISEVGAFSPAKYTIIGWEVPDIVVTVRELTDKGVSFSRYPHFQQDDLGIWTSPSGSKVAWFSDPDGNVLSLSQH
jgi:catechol 2,3-dioxygenase-like lactoylglutathione lyase family enzyme